MADLVRVVGVAGAGKTQFGVRQVEAWIERDGIDPNRIVLCSYTRSASHVLRGRMPVPTQNATTLHSLAFRGLGHCEVADGNKDLIKQWNESVMWPSWRIESKARSIEDDALTEMPEESPKLAEYSLWRSLGRVTPLPSHLSKFVPAWEDFKRQTDSIDFTDMIDYAVRDVAVCPGDPDCFVVDEAQDLNPMQWRLAKKWGAAAPYRFMVMGDPAQVLYSWVGARPDELLEPLPEERHYLLGRSYRNPRAVQAEAEGWLRYHSGTLTEGRYATPDDREGGVYHLPVTYTEPDGLVNAALEHMAEGKTTAILATCGFYLTPLLGRLREFGVPFWNPYRPSEGKWNPLRRMLEEGENTSSVQRIKCWMEQTGGPHGVTALEQLPATLFAGTRKKALELVMAGTMPDQVLQDEGAAAWRARDGEWYVKHMTEKSRKPLELAWNIYRRDPALLGEVPSVIVGTIHSMKGGEADHVYLLPDIPARVVGEAEDDYRVRDAVVRQVYVGITRARDAFYYCDPQYGKASVEALV